MFNNKSSSTNKFNIPKLSDRQSRIYSFLKENPVAVLSTVTPNNRPHGAVIYFNIDEHLAITFLTKTKTRKYDNIKHSDAVMLTVFEPKTQAVAQITGKAEEVTDSRDINRIAGLTMGASMQTSDAGLPPISKLHAGEYAAFTIKAAQISMVVYARPDSGEYSDLFETLESFELSID